MSSEHKGVWIELAVAVVTYLVYAVVVLGKVSGSSWATVPYVPLMLWAIGASIVATIFVRIVVTIVSPNGAGKKDVRDRQIYRLGEYTARWPLIVGALIALVLTVARVEYFWIANEIYLSFFVSAILAAAVKLVGYHRGVPSW